VTSGAIAGCAGAAPVLERRPMTIARRGFLGALALAPAALAGCSTGSAARKPAPPARAADGGGRDEGRAPTESRGVVLVRALTLPPDAEPAFTFRASAARAGGR
jgi:hypothetical protein